MRISVSQPELLAGRDSERFRCRYDALVIMSSGQNSGGLMSSAGLVRYFDAEDRNAITVDPKTVMVFCVLFGIFVQILNAIGV